MSYLSVENELAAHGVSLAKLKTAAPAATAANVPTATITVAGTVLQAAARADVAAAPTQAEFNDLLAKLRAAGILAP